MYEGFGKMFSKPWQSLAFVGGILVLVVIIFGGEGQPSGLSSAVEVAQSSAERRSGQGDETAVPPVPASEVAQFEDTGAGDQAEGFADFEIQEYGAPQLNPSPGNAPAASPGASSRNSSSNTFASANQAQGAPSGGTRNGATYRPRIMPLDPSDDPNLSADIRAALDKKAR